jgi:hypothetical protein
MCVFMCMRSCGRRLFATTCMYMSVCLSRAAVVATYRLVGALNLKLHNTEQRASAEKARA